jgi:cytochrome c peroxidase
LEEAVALMGTSQLGAKITAEEAGAIVAFLHTLTGKQPKVDYRSCLRTATALLPVTK